MKMPSFLRMFFKDQQGVAHIEMVLSLFVLVTILFGMVELTTYMRVKDRMNKTGEHLAKAMSTIPEWNPGLYVEPLMGAGEIMARPYGVGVAAAFCHGATGFSQTFSQTYGDGDCSGSAAAPGGTLSSVNCSDAQYNNQSYGDAMPTVEYVVVRTSCRYRPYLNYMGLFNDMVITSTAVAPMRHHMPW